MKTRATVILKDTSNWGQGIPGLTGDEICIVLTKGYVVLVSPEDVEYLSRVNWCTLVGRRQVKAVRNSTPDEQGKRQLILMHRQLMEPTDDQEVDHRDQHKFFCFKVVDNRRENLRNVTTSQNLHNQRKQVGCSSRFKGVVWRKRGEKWQAQIMINRRQIHLGLFTSQEEAAHAYNQAHQQYFPGITEGLNKIAA